MTNSEPNWISALRAAGYSVGQDRNGFYVWITQAQTSLSKKLTEGDAWAAARTHYNLTHPRLRSV